MFVFLRGNLRYIAISHEQKIVHRFEYRDFGSESRPDTAQLQANNAGTDNTEPLRYGIKFQRTPGINNLIVVKCGDPDFYWRRSGSQDDILRINDFNIAVDRCELHLLAGQ